jgi:hypothetical protein
MENHLKFGAGLFGQILSLFLYKKTSGFWPRVRARALRAPVF